MKFKPFYQRCTTFNYYCFGINGLFSITLFTNGVSFITAYFGTIYKKTDRNINWFPFSYRKIKYPDRN